MKKYLFLLFLVLALVSMGCSSILTEKSSTSPSVTLSTIAATSVTEDTILYSNGEIEYSVPETWQEDSEGFYHNQNGGRLRIEYIDYDYSGLDIMDEEDRHSYMGDIEIITESEIPIAGTEGYRVESFFNELGVVYDLTYVLFNHKGGIILIEMTNPRDSESDYSDDLTNILASIKFVDEEAELVKNPSFTKPAITKVSELDFRVVYNAIINADPSLALYIEVAEDGNSLFADTNPYDDENHELDVMIPMGMIGAINEVLLLPDTIAIEMLNTTLSDGFKKYEGDVVTINWKYSPMSGLEAYYTWTNSKYKPVNDDHLKDELLEKLKIAFSEIGEVNIHDSLNNFYVIKPHDNSILHIALASRDSYTYREKWVTMVNAIVDLSREMEDVIPGCTVAIENSANPGNYILLVANGEVLYDIKN